MVAQPADGRSVPPTSAHLLNIQASLDDGFYALAEQQVRGILRSDPDDETERQAVLLLSHALWGQKRYSEVLDLLEGRHGETGYLYWRARALFELREIDEALRYLSLAENDDPDSQYAPAVLRLRGHIQQQAGRFEAAEAAFMGFSEAYPEHTDRIENLFDLAAVYAEQNKQTDAIALYELLVTERSPAVQQRAQLKWAHLLYTRVQGDATEQARTMLTELATNTQSRLSYRIDAWVDLAALKEMEGQVTGAVDALEEAVRLSPDARQRVPVKLSLAQMLLRENDTDGALKLLEECRAEVPNERLAALLQLEKAGALLQAGRFAEADEAYQVYLAVAVDDEGLTRAYYGKGLALWETGRFAEAASAFDKAVERMEKSETKASALFKAGDAYYRAGNMQDAEQRYRSFVQRFPNHPDMPNALYQQGLALAESDRRTEAFAVFQQLESEHANSIFAEKAALRSAGMMRAGGQWEAALDKYILIGETYTNGTAPAVTMHQRGLVLSQLQRFPEAQQAFETVLDEYPESEHVPQATYMRGFCLYWQGNPEEAVQTCRAFIEQYPESEWAPKVIFWLAEQYYNQAAYGDAEPLFMRVATDFKSDSLAPYALYWSGRCAAAEANYVRALERFSTVAKEYPQSDVLARTRFSQGDALSELGEFARAILAFDEVIKNYPDSHLITHAWGRKGDCQFSLASGNSARYAEAMLSYQAILDRPLASYALRLQAEYKLGRCLEKTDAYEQAFNRYMNVVYTFINEPVERSPYSAMWFTRAAFGAAALKEREREWVEAEAVYRRVVEADVPAAEEAGHRIEKIRSDNWLLFNKAEEMNHVGTDG